MRIALAKILLLNPDRSIFDEVSARLPLASIGSIKNLLMQIRRFRYYPAVRRAD